MKPTLRNLALWALAILAPALCRCAGSHPKSVTVFVIDEFGTTDSHGAQVRSAIGDTADGCCRIRQLSAGQDRIDVRLYLKSLSQVMEYAKENPHVGVVVNLSFGSYSPNPLEEGLIEALSREGAVLVAAAGNEGDPQPQYPAAYGPVTAVGAVDSAGKRAPYSNYGAHVDLAAQGFLNREVVSSRLESDGARLVQRTVFLIRGGTSFSSGRVAGLLANVWSRRPDLSGRQALELLKSTATPAADGLGAGVIAPHRALMSADPAYRRYYELKWQGIRLGVFLFFTGSAVLLAYYLTHFLRLRKEELARAEQLKRSLESPEPPRWGAGQILDPSVEEPEQRAPVPGLEVAVRCSLCGTIFSTPFGSLNHRIGICPDCRDKIVNG